MGTAAAQNRDRPGAVLARDFGYRQVMAYMDRISFDRFPEPIYRHPKPETDPLYEHKRRLDMALERKFERMIALRSNIINLTPHDVNIYDADGKEVIRTYPASGQVARVKVTTKKIDSVDGVDIVKTNFDEIEGLPDPKPGTKYIVSLLVLQATSGKRDDLIGPDTGPESVVRDEKGQIIGVRRFQIL